MTFQTSVPQYQDAFGPAGSRYGAGHDPEQAYHNNETPVPGVWTLTVTYDGAGSYTATINGIPVTVPQNTDADTTAADLEAALEASPFLDTIADFTVAGAVVTVTELTPGSIAAITAAATGGAAALALASTTASVVPDDLDGGLIVHGDSALSGKIVRLPRAAPTGTVYLAGVTAHLHRGIDRRSANQSLYPAGSQIPIGRKGGYILTCETALSESDSIFYRITASGSNTQLGAIRNDNDGGNAVALSGARALRAIAAPGRVPVFVSLG